MRKNIFGLSFKIWISLLAIFVFSAGCGRSGTEKNAAPAALRDIPALKLNFRFEPDVPEPSAAKQNSSQEERVQAVQSDFDANRTQEALDRTIISPDKQQVLAVYHRPEDAQAEYRLDMYAADGRLIHKITPDGMAVHFPDTIVWSPDSINVAFVATGRIGGGQTVSPEVTAPTPPAVITDANSNANGIADANANVNANANSNAALPAYEPAKTVLTFRTEQIYSVNREGNELKPLTQNEGLLYFYFVWSPDSSMLTALAATWREWQVGQAQADQRGEIFIPVGRPRLVEKNGRERRLDDNVTSVHPVWSPDSAKVALAFDKEIRVYDAIGDSPTQAALPLRNPLLLSSKTFDDELRRKEQSGNSNPNGNTNGNANSNAAAANSNTGSNVNVNANAGNNSAAAPTNSAVSTLPDENMLVSFNPVVSLEWTQDQMLYLETGYIKEMKDSNHSAHSYLRWHRLIFSPQPTAIN